MAGQAHFLQLFFKIPPRRTHTEKETPIPIKTSSRKSHTTKEVPIPNEVQSITPANHSISTTTKASSRWQVAYIWCASTARLPPQPRYLPSPLLSFYPWTRPWNEKSRYGRESALRHPGDTRSIKTGRGESRSGPKGNCSSCVNSRRLGFKLRLSLKPLQPWQRRSLSVIESS